MTSPIYTYTITTVTSQRRSIFIRTANAELLVDTLFHYRDQRRYLLHGFAIMPEHIHILITPTEHQTLERCALCIKGGYSHAIRKQFEGEIWQPGYHAHRIRDAADFQNQLAYIANNPERRRLHDHPHVHTKFSDRLDPTPANLVAHPNR